MTHIPPSPSLIAIRHPYAARLGSTSALKLASAGLAALGAILVAKLYGASGLGVYALLRAVPGILNIFTDLGIHQSYPWLVANRQLRPSFVFAAAGSAIAFIGVAQFVIGMALWIPLSSMVFGDLSPSLAPIFAVIAPMMLIETHVTNILRAMDRIGLAIAIKPMVESVLLAAIAIPWLAGKAELAALPAAVAVSHGLAALASLAIAWRIGLPLHVRFHKILLKGAIGFGLKRQIGSAFLILNYRLDYVILGLFTEPAVVGVYAVATRVAEIFRFFGASINFALESTIAGRRKNAARFVINAFWPLFGANLLMLVVAWLAGPTVIALLFEDWSARSVLPFNILLVGLLLGSCNGLFASYFSGLGKPSPVSIAYGIGLVFTLVLNFYLVPIYQEVGAAISSTVAYTVSGLSLAALFRWRDRLIRKIH